MTAYKKWALVPMVSAMLVACGGDSGQDGGNAPVTGTEGRVTLAGGLANATIFVDLNNSSSHDEDEPIGYTDSQGFFGYNPVTHTNYCKSQDLTLRQHCLRLPSLSNLPDDVTLFYFGGVNLVTGQQNEKVYRYHVQVDQLRGQDLDLNAAKAAVSAAADSQDGLDILYSIIDAFYQKYITTPVGFAARSAVPYASDNLSAQEKFDALVEAGIFEGMDDGSAALDEGMTRAQLASVMQRLLGLDQEPPSQSPFADISSSEWQFGYIAGLGASFEDVNGGTFTPPGDVTMEQLAAIMTRALGLQPVDQAVPGQVSDWAQQYVQAAVNAGLINGGLDYSSPDIRSQLVLASYEAYSFLEPEADPQLENQVSSALLDFIETLLTNSSLNDSFSETEFNSLLDGVEALIEDATENGQHLNVDTLHQFLLDESRDWTNWDAGNFDALLLDAAFFDATMDFLQGKVLDIHYSDPAKGEGRLQLLLSAGEASAITAGRLQACVRYEEAGVPDSEQRFKQPLYVSGDWRRINDNSILLNMQLLPGYTDSRVLQLDWTQVTVDPSDMNTLRFDMTDELEDWSFDVLPTVPSAWAVMDDNRDAANASCALFLAD
jgi:hypothetical protein